MLTRTVSELDSHYLVLTISPGEKDYQIPMLLSNPVHGILPVHLQEPDGMCELWYEITSLRPVSEVFRAKKITPEEMLRIFLSVSDTVSELERFLLRSSGIQLNPELIYQNDAEEIFFCYSPAQGISSQENLGLLARFIVDHIDYADRETTRLAYDLFQESMKETVSLQDFLRIAMQSLQRENQIQGKNRIPGKRLIRGEDAGEEENKREEKQLSEDDLFPEEDGCADGRTAGAFHEGDSLSEEEMEDFEYHGSREMGGAQDVLMNRAGAVEPGPEDLDLDDSEALYKARNTATKNINQSLAVVGEQLKFSINLSMHVARHTFAVFALNNGLSMSVVSRLLGHGSTDITERVYAKFLPETLASEVSKLSADTDSLALMSE